MTDRLRLILLGTWVGGAAAIVHAIRTPQLQVSLASSTGAMTFALALVSSIISEMKPVPYSFGPERKETSLTTTIVLATMFVYDWPVALLAAAAGVAVADILLSKPYYKVLFNSSVYALSTGAAAAAYHLVLSPLNIGTAPIPQQILAGGAAGLAFYVTNVALLMLAISEAQGDRMFKMLLWDARDSGTVTLALTSIAIAFAILWQVHPAAATLLLPALYMVKAGYQSYTQVRNETESVLAALADLIDLRDHNTGQHSVRVAEMSWGVAQRMGLSADQALAIKAIARVHDIGKIAVRDEILLKPGGLTPNEMAEIQTHIEAGSQIISYLSVYRPHLAFLLQHHERFDGSGYPAGERGQEIAIGARIIAACDAYDTMTSDRPYRRAVSAEEAMVELRRCAGTQFDPQVVQVLEGWLTERRKLRPDWRQLVDDTAGQERFLPPEPNGQSSRPAPVNS